MLLARKSRCDLDFSKESISFVLFKVFLTVRRRWLEVVMAISDVFLLEKGQSLLAVAMCLG